MMRGVATLDIKQYGKYQLSAINDSGESLKNREYFCTRREGSGAAGLLEGVEEV
jgi:hypothetical protein